MTVVHRRLDNRCFGFRLALRFGWLLPALCALQRTLGRFESAQVTTLSPRLLDGGKTHKNVPPEKSNNTPVHHFISAGSALPPPPNALTTTHVPTAPAGAARLNTTRCALAPLFPKPCFSSTDVSPNAAGALWTMIATKMIRESEAVEDEVDDAPSAIPSAAACMQRPSVVERDRCGEAGVGGGDVDRSERE